MMNSDVFISLLIFVMVSEGFVFARVVSNSLVIFSSSCCVYVLWASCGMWVTMVE